MGRQNRTLPRTQLTHHRPEATQHNVADNSYNQKEARWGPVPGRLLSPSKRLSSKKKGLAGD